MKNAVMSRLVFVSLFAAAILVTPTVALSTALANISSYSTARGTETGPANVIDTIGSWFGINLIGPTGDPASISGNGVFAVGAASSFRNVSWYAVWEFGRTQKSTEIISWAAIYQLNANTGQTADISLDYTYKNTSHNYVFDGRSESKSSANFAYGIFSPGAYTQTAQKVLSDYTISSFPSIIQAMLFPNWVFESPQSSDYTKSSLGYDKNYHFAAITSNEETATGSIPIGTMGVGDQLFFVGSLIAETQAQAYAAGVNIAAMVTSLTTNLIVEDNPIPPAPVPEPVTSILLAVGLLGIGWGSKSFLKK